MEVFDVFVEQLVARNIKKSEFTLKMVLFAICGLFSGLLFLLGVFNLVMMPLYALVIAGAIFLVYYLGGRFNIEFEYCLTNGLFDVDIITNMKSRKRIASFECKSVEDFGKYDSEAQYGCNKKIMAANADADQLYYFIYNSKESGKVLLVIEPNEKMINGLKRCLPRQMTFKVFG